MRASTNVTRWAVVSVFFVAVLSRGVWATGTYDGGDGSAGDPFRINTAGQMDEIGQHSEDWASYFILTADIDLSGYTGTDFHIIGNTSTNFTGEFDGNGLTISNFSYTSTGASGYNYKGIFGVVGSAGEIKDLGLVNASVTGETKIGGMGDCPTCKRGGQISSFLHCATQVSGTPQQPPIAHKSSVSCRKY